MPVAAVAFDLDDTLAVPDRDRQTLLDEATAAAGAPRFSRRTYLDAHADHLTRETRAPVFRSLLADAAPGTDVDPEALATAYRDRVSGSLVPVGDVEGLVADLRGRYRVGLLTNGPTVAQRDKLDTLGWAALFDVALVTGELSAGKPDAAAFDALLSALGTAPAETVYVGDDVDADVAGAAAAGLRPVQVISPDGPDPDPRAAAHVDRSRLDAALPAVLDRL
jgi:putative hydrolase of the HAD superfamily